MGERAEALAREYEQIIGELRKTVEQASDEQWRAKCGTEGWTVAATAQHIADQLGLEREYLTAAAEGTPMPTYTWDDINGINEKRAAAKSAATKDEVIGLLEKNIPPTVQWVRGLSDEQLDRTSPLPLADGAMVSTQDLIKGGVLIDHARVHLQSIRSAK